MARFAEVIECLKNGGTATREAWGAVANKEIMMQIPQRIAKEIVPKMTSVQEIMKPKIENLGTGEIEYHHQVLMIEFSLNSPARATYFIPTWEDIMAEDWMLSQAPESYKGRMKSEYIDLSDKVEKLKVFVHTQLFNDLSSERRSLMLHQYDAMVEYRDNLKARCELEGIDLPDSNDCGHNQL